MLRIRAYDVPCLIFLLWLQSNSRSLGVAKCLVSAELRLLYWIVLLLPIRRHQHCYDSGLGSKQLGYFNTEKFIAIVA